MRGPAVAEMEGPSGPASGDEAPRPSGAAGAALDSVRVVGDPAVPRRGLRAAAEAGRTEETDAVAVATESRERFRLLALQGKADVLTLLPCSTGRSPFRGRPFWFRRRQSQSLPDQGPESLSTTARSIDHDSAFELASRKTAFGVSGRRRNGNEGRSHSGITMRPTRGQWYRCRMIDFSRWFDDHRRD